MRWRDVKQNKTAKKEQKKKAEKEAPPFASNFDKIKAFITDSFLLAMPIFYVVIYFIMGDREGFEENMITGWIYILIPLGVIIPLFYKITGQTPGYKAYSLKVIDNKTGKKPGFVLAFLRFFFFNIAFFSIIGVVIMLFRKDKKGLHDLLSGTSVITSNS